MKPNTIITTLAVVIVLAVLFMWGYAGKGSTAASVQNAGGPVSTSALTSAERFHDFGTISMARGTVVKMFEIANPTNRDITLESLTTSCMCTNAFIVKSGERRGPYGMPGHGGSVPKANELVRAGEKLTIAVVYDPGAHGPAGVGSIDRFVYLEDDTGAKLELEIKANVTP